MTLLFGWIEIKKVVLLVLAVLRSEGY